MNHKDMFKLKVISRPLLKLGNKNAILTSHFMPNSSGLTAILIICLFYESAHLCYVKYLRFTCILNQLKIVTFFYKKFEEDSRFLSVIFYFLLPFLASTPAVLMSPSLWLTEISPSLTNSFHSELKSSRWKIPYTK